jgi:hypothetical protein
MKETLPDAILPKSLRIIKTYLPIIKNKIGKFL